MDADVLRLIEGRRDNLTISRDEWDDRPCAVLLYIPDTEEHEHEHLVLDLETCRRLRSWLGAFIRDMDVREFQAVSAPGIEPPSCDHIDGYGSLVLDGMCMVCHEAVS